LGRSYGSFSGTLLSRTMDWCQSPADWDSAEDPRPSLSKARSFRAFAAEKEGENLFSVRDCCLGIAKRVSRGEGLEGLHKDACRQRDANMRVWWKEKQGRGDYGMYELEWGTIILGRAGYNAVIVGK
jgi:hypothetical protein